MKTLSFIFLYVFTSLSVYAQEKNDSSIIKNEGRWSVGIVGGALIAKPDIDFISTNNDYTVDEFKMQYNIGVYGGLKIGKKTSALLGISYDVLGYKWEETGDIQLGPNYYSKEVYSYKFWSIPLLFKVNFGKQRINYGVFLGPQLTMLSENGEMVYNSNLSGKGFYYIQRFTNKKILFSGVAGGEVNYNLNNKINFLFKCDFVMSQALTGRSYNPGENEYYDLEYVPIYLRINVGTFYHF